MITFRHHLTSLVAVFLALAVGIALGGGLLHEQVASGDADPEAAGAPQADPRGAYADGFAAAVAPTLLSGRLAERSVALVTLPGADENVVTALSEQVAAAGGSVTARFSLTDTWTTPEQKSLVDTLGSQLMTQQPEGSVAAEATTYDRVGELLGDAVATTEESATELNGKSRAVLDSLAGGELLTAPEEVAKRAPLVLLVLGEPPAAEGGDAILGGLVTGLARAARGVVVAGTTADGGDGQLGRLRGDPVAAQVATVDGIDTAAGRTATVLAVARSHDADGGAFGASGADGAAPLG
ncbi:copper transporter [Nocardioides gansuensis]|uniref:copper transporter n=1 Tax=Nocardioides gansuensis TaxID=2138300 RepID=UPI001402E2FF|nr:copper transporter [Nocardioides gansuensis]